MSNKPALGRGLGSLIPQKAPTTIPKTEDHTPEVVLVKETSAVFELSPDKIIANPRQPRRYFEEAALEDLKSSIASHGLLQPLVVNKVGDHYELIAGERRLRACQSLGLEKVPVILREATDQQKLELALIENIQREDLNPVEEALAYRTLTEEFGLRQDVVAERVGKSRGAIANLIRILDLPDHMLDAVREGRLSKSHARTLLAEPDPTKQESLFKAMLAGLSVRDAEKKTGNAGSRPHYGAKLRDPNLMSLERRIRDRLATKVTIREKDGRGRLQIDYYSREELEAILRELGFAE